MTPRELSHGWNSFGSNFAIRSLHVTLKDRKRKYISWWEFRPRLKIFSPPTPIPHTHPPGPSPPPNPPGKPPPGIFNKKSSPPLPAPRTPLPLRQAEKKIRDVHQEFHSCSAWVRDGSLKKSINGPTLPNKHKLSFRKCSNHVAEIDPPEKLEYEGL